MARRISRKPRKTPTQARAKATWNAILEAAARVLVQRGYEKATTDRIAERAGVGIGSLYEYFPNKEAIFAILNLRWNEERWSGFQAELASAPQDDLQTLIRSTVRARINATRRNPRLNSALRNLIPLSVTQPQARAIYEEFAEHTVRALQSHARLGDRDPRLVAQVMLHATHAVIDNVADMAPELLDSPALEDELALMLYRYVSSSSARD